MIITEKALRAIVYDLDHVEYLSHMGNSEMWIEWHSLYLKVVSAINAINKETSKEDLEIIDLWKKGLTLSYIGEKYNKDFNKINYIITKFIKKIKEKMQEKT